MIYRRNLKWNSTLRICQIRSLTPILSSKWYHTLYNRTSIDWSCILNADHVWDAGDVIAVAVAVAAGNGLAAAGNGRPTHRQNSWDSLASFSSSNKAGEMIKRIVRQLYQVLQNVIKEVLIKAALMVVRLCYRWVHTRGVDPSANLAVGNVYHFRLKLLRGRTKIHVEMTK